MEYYGGNVTGQILQLGYFSGDTKCFITYFFQFQIIQEKPETPYGLKVIDKKGRMVKLSWQAPYNGNSNLTRYVIEFKPSKGSWRKDIDHVLVPGDQTMAAVFSLKPATSYHFR